MAFFPKNVRAGERGVAAEIHLDGRGQPAQTVSAVFGMQKRGLGEVHFAGDIAHPLFIGAAGSTHTAAGFPAKGRGRESIDLDDADRHESIIFITAHYWGT